MKEKDVVKNNCTEIFFLFIARSPLSRGSWARPHPQGSENKLGQFEGPVQPSRAKEGLRLTACRLMKKRKLITDK